MNIVYIAVEKLTPWLLVLLLLHILNRLRIT